jgi:hypothetical protein
MSGEIDHADVVKQVRNFLAALGLDLTAACGAFEITKRVAWQLRGEGAGLLDKPAGNNCRGYASDIVAYPDGTIIDILGDAGGANTPQWNSIGVVGADRYRPAIDPGDAPPPPPPPPPPAPPLAIAPYDEAQVDGFTVDAAMAYQAAHQTINFGAARWIAQMQFDAVSIGYAAARAKQLAALRRQLGLQP